MRLKEEFVLREVCGETVIIGEGLGAVDFGKLLVLNDTAAWLWKEAREMGYFTIESLVSRLCQEYDVTEDFAIGDVTEIVTKWHEVGVLD